MDDRRESLIARYEEGDVPWDAEEPPPEVIALAALLPAGRALDLGTGYGRTAMYLAERGWEVDAVDFVPQAIAEARRRAKSRGIPGVRFHVGPVTDMSYLRGPVDLAVDVGCAHGLTPVEVPLYAAELRRLLRPGAAYLLFAHVRHEEDEEPDRWLDEPTFLQVMNEGFALERAEHGTTQVGDNPPWRSAWYWFRRLPQGKS